MLATLTALTQEARKVDWQEKVLQSLRFDTMDNRQLSALDSHDRTLSWIFEDKAVDDDDAKQAKTKRHARTSLRDFFSKEVSLYWVSGNVCVTDLLSLN